MYRKCYIFPGPCRLQEGSPAQGLSFLAQGREGLLGHCAGTQRESSAQVQWFSSTSDWPREGVDLAAKLHNWDPTGGLPPSFCLLHSWIYASAGQQMSLGDCVCNSQRAIALLSRAGSCNRMGHKWSLVLYIQIHHTLYHKGHFALT